MPVGYLYFIRKLLLPIVSRSNIVWVADEAKVIVLRRKSLIFCLFVRTVLRKIKSNVTALISGTCNAAHRPLVFAYALFRELSHTVHWFSWHFNRIIRSIGSHLECSRAEQFPVSRFGLYR
jgi:hypothetical protein